MATSTIKPKCGTTAQWAASGRILEVNEWGVEETESGGYILRIGDGEHRFHDLAAVIDTPMLYEIEAQVEAMRLETAGFRDAAEVSAGASATSAAQAKTASDAAKSALQGVQTALNNLPAGDTLVINDLTTGGASAALSAEMGKILAKRPNPNLLHNWCFANCVNQKGQTEYAVKIAGSYCFDRWRTRNAIGTITVEEDGIRITNADITGTGSAVFVEQRIDPTSPDINTTLSILVSDITGTAYTQVICTDGSLGSSGGVLTPGLRAVDNSRLYGKSVNRILIQVNSGASVKIKAVKLEYGSVQTLAHQDTDGNWVLNETPDYGDELLKCQRYYQLFSSADAMPKNLVDYRPTMRANPATGTIDINGVTYWYADANL